SEERRTVSIYDVQRSTTAPVIEGKLEDTAWKNRPAITPLVLRDEKTRIAAAVQTRTMLIYNDQALFIGIHMDEPFPRTLRAQKQQYDGHLWWDDSVELYIEPGHSHKVYYKFMSNSLGTRADWRGMDTPEGFKLLDWGTGTSWKAAAHVGRDFWSLEFRFPWSDLEVEPPKTGDVWSFEVVRFRYANSPKAKPVKGQKRYEYSSWNMGASYRRPDRFGNIVFDGQTDQLERLLADRLGPVLGDRLRIYGRRGEILYTSYPALLNEKLQLAKTGISALKRRLDRLEGQVQDKVLESLNSRNELLVQELTDLAKTPPSATSAEAALKLLGRIEELEWSLKFQEMNLKLDGNTGKSESMN
ncbi:MAG: sugar-binding protein, partial [Planctomycetota bacterium]|nr:sugar-binding protein [Planctomycetota bacterium]